MAALRIVDPRLSSKAVFSKSIAADIDPHTAKVDFLEPHKKVVMGSVNQTISVCSGTPASANAC